MGLLLAGAAASGCARAVEGERGGEAATTRSVVAEQRGEDVEGAVLPLPVLPAGRTLPATREEAVTRPSLDAVHLYGRAYLDLQSGRRLTAVGLLEEAARLDPNSAAVQQMLAQALLESAGGGGGAGFLERAIVALRRAAELQPDHLETWYRLGRVHAAREEWGEALLAYRTAGLTTEYGSDRARAALVDLHTARAFHRLGHVEAALGRYRRVLAAVADVHEGRLSVPRDVVELRVILQREDLLYGEVGGAMERAGMWGEAADLYALSAARDPAAIEAHGRWARALVAAGRRAQAVEVAGRLVGATQANPAAVDLLMLVAGSPEAAVRELARQAEGAGGQVALQRALVQALREAGETEAAFARAKAALGPSVMEGAADRMLLRSVMSLSVELGRAEEGAAVLVGAMTRCRRSDPTVVAEAVQVLVEPSKRGRLTLGRLARLPVAAGEEAARDYLLATASIGLGRVELARGVLRRIGSESRAAVLLWAQDLTTRGDLSATAFDRERVRLVEAARRAGGPPLETAVSAWVSMASGGSAAVAVRQLSEAREAGVSDPATGMALAEGLRRMGDTQRLEALLGRLGAEFPDHAAVQVLVIRHLLGTGRAAMAEQRLAVWSSLDPTEVATTTVSIGLALDVRRDVSQAVRLAESAMRGDALDRGVLQAAERAFTAGQQGKEFVRRLEEAFGRSPRSLEVVRRWLVELVREGRREEALGALRRSVAASAGDADLLYVLSGLAYGLGFQGEADGLLGQVLAAEPEHAGAANDLAYHLAEREDLDPAVLQRALKLATVAVRGEPEVAAYLDTLGWVHYRRGEFELALVELEAAAELMSPVEGVIADHLGDTLWRLGRREDAEKWWRVALEQLKDDESDSQLAGSVRKKLENLGSPAVARSLADR